MNGEGFCSFRRPTVVRACNVPFVQSKLEPNFLDIEPLFAREVGEEEDRLRYLSSSSTLVQLLPWSTCSSRAIFSSARSALGDTAVG